MKHYGDITKLSGYDLPVVDVITGGSPCQDLSVAGKREGLAGERSGLFMEQIRIVKEMRERDIRSGRSSFDARPRFMVWENVPGAFSSNKGKDFQAVLTEIVRIADGQAPDVPMPDGGGLWVHAGCLYDYLGRWSVAWRVHDAQFWGVPQRRKRIALVADFGGLAAPEILFEREGVSGDSEPCGEERKEVTGGTGEGVEKPVLYDAYQHHGYRMGVTSGTLTKDQNGNVRGDTPLVCYGIVSYNSNSMKSSNPNSGIYEADTSRTLDNNCGNPACNQGGMAVVYDGSGITSPVNASNPMPGDPCHTLHDDSRNYVVAIEGNGSRPSHQGDGYTESETMYTLNSTEKHAVFESHGQDARYKALGETCETISAKYGMGGGNAPIVLNDQGGSQMHVTEDQTGTLRSQMNGHPPITISDTVGALCSADHKGAGQQYVEQGKLVW